MNKSLNRKRRGRILAGAMVLLLTAELFLAGQGQSRLSESGSESGNTQAAAAPAVRRVTLYDVQTVNSRLRPMAAEETYTVADDWEGVTYRSVQLDDIPLVEVFQDDGKEKPLLLFLHGLGQSKERMLPALTAFARAGYYAVSMDAYEHGQRSSGEMCDNWAAMLITAEDINEVVSYYRGAEDVEAENFVLGGFSMGGVEAWAYTQLGEYTPGALLAVSGVCELSAWQPDKLELLYSSWLARLGPFVTAVYGRQTPDYTNSKYEAIESLNITEHLSSYSDIPIFCCIGTEDSYFDSAAAENTVQAIAEAGNDSAVFKAYEGEIHRLTGQMISDSIAFLAGTVSASSTEQI